MTRAESFRKLADAAEALALNEGRRTQRVRLMMLCQAWRAEAADGEPPAGLRDLATPWKPPFALRGGRNHLRVVDPQGATGHDQGSGAERR